MNTTITSGTAPFSGHSSRMIKPGDFIAAGQLRTQATKAKTLSEKIRLSREVNRIFRTGQVPETGGDRATPGGRS